MAKTKNRNTEQARARLERERNSHPDRWTDRKEVQRDRQRKSADRLKVLARTFGRDYLESIADEEDFA